MLDPEIIDLFTDKLDLETYLPEAARPAFWHKIEDYMNHRRNEQLGGRTYEYLLTKLDQLVTLFTKLELTKGEIINVIQEFPSILNSNYSDIYNKFLLLGITEDDASLSKRKAMLIRKPRDYVVGLDLLFARYAFLCEVGYPQITYSILIHDSEAEFANKFIKKAYFKPYQIYNDVSEISSAILIAKYPFNEAIMESVKAWPINQRYADDLPLTNSL